MRNGYTPPPGYDGSRFVRNRDRVTAIGDGDYTLSVGGIPRSGYREDQKLRSDMRDDAGARRTRGGYRTPHRSTSGSGEEERAVRDAEGTRPRPAAENARNAKTARIRARYVRTI